MLTICFVWATIATLWAIVATLIHFRNPLPIPDRGHRIYGVLDERSRQTVVEVLKQTSHLKEQYTFDSGPTHQTLMWDGFTVINYLDTEIRNSLNTPATGLSVPVPDPLRSASRAVQLLQSAGYEAKLLDNIDDSLPPNHLIPITSNAFDNWVLVFRKPLIKMPYPQKRANT